MCIKARAVIDYTADLHSSGDSGIALRQDDICHFLRDVGTVAHGDAYVGSLKRRSVVDTVTSHGHDTTGRLEDVHN